VLNVPDLPSAFPALRGSLHNVADTIRRLVAGATVPPGAWPAGFADQLESAALHGVELLVPVIAPLKAGKSTLINAILGETILPTRPLPSTYLPTRVVFGHTAAGAQPLLELSSATTHTVRALITALTEALANGTTTYPPPVDGLVDRLRRGGSIVFPQRRRGATAISGVLTELNDVVRLAVQVLSAKGIAIPTMEQPQVYAPGDSLPFPSSTGIPIVLVDMPSTDDATSTPFIATHLAEQLGRAHAVILVVDYSRLSNQAASVINHALQPFVDLLGPTALWPVVNRVDQRRCDNDLDADGVRRLLTHTLALDDPTRIVEVSAEQGLVARGYLRALARCQPGTYPSDKATAALLRTIYPTEQHSRNPGPEQLTGLAGQLLTVSGMPELFANVLMPLFRDAVSTSWRATLARLQAGGKELAGRGSDLTEFTDRVADLAWRISRLEAADHDR